MNQAGTITTALPCANIDFMYPWVKYLHQLTQFETLPDKIQLNDHLGGFDLNFRNPILDEIGARAFREQKEIEIYWSQPLAQQTKNIYKNLKVRYMPYYHYKYVFKSLLDYKQHPELTFQKFLCSFNGSGNVGRQLLTAILHVRNWADSDTVTKNFTVSPANIDGHLQNFVPYNTGLYLKFFLNQTSSEYLNKIVSFDYKPLHHIDNIKILDKKITKCFLHLVSENIPTSRVPHISEKFLYSVVTRGLFVAFAQPGWHRQLEDLYGIKPFAKLFNYTFDSIINPVERLVELTNMLSVFSNLSPLDWHDLYELERDTIEYNYDHYFSGGILAKMQQYARHLC